MRECNVCGSKIPKILPDCFKCVPMDCDQTTWDEYQSKKKIDIDLDALKRDINMDALPEKLMKALTSLDFMRDKFRKRQVEPNFRVDFSKERVQSGEIGIYPISYVEQLETQVKTLEAIIDNKGDGDE